MQEASSSTIHRPRLNHTCAPVSRGTERNFFATAEISIFPPPPSYQKPHFHYSSLLSKFKPSLLLTDSSASSQATLLLAGPTPHWRPFFLQRHLLAGNPTSCCAACSPRTLLLAARPRRYGQVIHTPPTPSSSFPVPHAPTDGATPSAEITIPLL